ncbi:MAG: hypothetical protein FJZ85_04010 [Chloroflexi bacterium]|nr:hypothetical protein [Chloroflexota bacterium]
METGHESGPVLEATGSSKHIAKERLAVCVYTSIGIFSGYVHCIRSQRLLDLLNSALVGGLRAYFDFLPLTQVTIYFSDGTEATTKTTLINKDNILFVTEDGQTSGIDSGGTGKSLPRVSKSPVVANLCVPPYKLRGEMHSIKGQRLSDLLNTGDRFLPITNVEIVAPSGDSQAVSFVAINKAQIIYSEETSH